MDLERTLLPLSEVNSVSVNSVSARTFADLTRFIEYVRLRQAIRRVKSSLVAVTATAEDKDNERLKRRRVSVRQNKNMVLNYIPLVEAMTAALVALVHDVDSRASRLPTRPLLQDRSF